MLINFRVENFRSFRDEVEFTALATTERQHRDRVFHHGPSKLSVLPVTAFYGGNGAGKSNLYHALKFARHLIVRGGVKPEDRIAREPFRLDPACLLAPSIFGFDLLIDGQQVRYTFSVTHEAVQEESLELFKADTYRTVFKRTRAKGKYAWAPDSFKVLKLEPEQDDFVRFKGRDTLPNELFLGAVRGRDIPLLEEVGHWFMHQLVLIDPHSEFRPAEFNLSHIEAFRDYCLESLDRADTGISKITNEPISLDAVKMPKHVIADVFIRLEASKEKQVVIMRGPERIRYMFSRENGETKAFKLTTARKDIEGKTVSFDLADESEGTERLIDLLPAFYELTSPDTDKVFFIDELDRSLHTHLTRKLIEAFLAARTAKSRSQLLFTTHDPLLLDQDLLRRDEVWFITKQSNGHSDLTALSDFKGVRYDRDIRKSYLLGRFTGVPALRTLPQPAAEPVAAE
jgi:AAA15 family ATPase/GTPase